MNPKCNKTFCTPGKTHRYLCGVTIGYCYRAKRPFLARLSGRQGLENIIHNIRTNNSVTEKQK